MAPVLLDTDIFSEVLRRVNPKVSARAAVYRVLEGRYAVTSLTVMEVVRGHHRYGREHRIEELFAALADVDVLPFDLRTVEVAGRIEADLQRVGRPIGRVDNWRE